MTAPFRQPAFFLTAPAPCPYLPDRLERKLFTPLEGPRAAKAHDSLGRLGFRRSQRVAYRPACAGCKACVSVRVETARFAPDKGQRRTLRRHADLIVDICRAQATSEQFDLMKRYLEARHPDGAMTEMDEEDFACMVGETPVDSIIVEYRLPSGLGRRPGQLIGFCLTDCHDDGLSMVYSAFAPALAERPGLGSFIILDHIQRARAAGLPYVYLGYWIAQSERMAYKARFRPLERLGPEGWVPLAP